MKRPAKTCPACGNANGASDIFCRVCGADISHVVPAIDAAAAVTPKTSTKAHTKAPATSITNLSGPSQPCPRCGYRNPSFVMLCPHCGADIPHTDGTEIGPARAPAPMEGDPPTRLKAVIDGAVYQLRPGDVLGREGTVAPAYFADIGTVSRHHAAVEYRDNAWWLVVPRSVKNVTQLDGHEVPRDEPQPLRATHKLMLSTRCGIELAVTPV